MEEEKKNKLCAILLTHAPQLIQHATLLYHVADNRLFRHPDDEYWALDLVERDLKFIVLAAAEFGITTENAIEWKNGGKDNG